MPITTVKGVLGVPGQNGEHRKARVEMLQPVNGDASRVMLTLWRGTPRETTSGIPFGAFTASVDELRAALASPQTMQLYFIGAANDDGESLDLFVIADTREQAIQLFRAYYSAEDDEEADNLGVPKEPKTVWQVPAAQVSAPARALAWDSDDVREVTAFPSRSSLKQT